MLHVVVENKECVKPLIDSNAFGSKKTIVPLKDVRVVIPNQEQIWKIEEEHDVVYAISPKVI